MLLLKKDCGGKVVTCMSPDFLLLNKMDLCFVPGHDRVKPRDNILFTSGPPGTVAFTDMHDKDRGLILVGGIDRKSHHWDSAGTISCIRSILEKSTLGSWTISSSPRTPKDMILLLQELAEQHSHVDFIRSEETPEGWIEDAYAQNYFVWVTADSISMIYEALTAGCEVGICPVQWKKRNRKFRRAEKNLLENRLVRPYEKWLAGEEGAIEPLRLDEASRCAEEILKRWWPDRLQ
jgi:mitochondrial fission protein ELM1